MPETGPVLVLANHQSYYDPVLCGLASRRYLTFLARETLFKNRYFKGLIESLDAIPIDLKGLGREGLELTRSRLEEGKCVLVFPEGERTHDGEMHPFKAGIALLLRRIQCPIVPIGLDGAFAAWSRFATRPSFSPMFLGPTPASIALSVGKPIHPAELAGMERDALVAYLHGKVKEEFERARALKRK